MVIRCGSGSPRRWNLRSRSNRALVSPEQPDGRSFGRARGLRAARLLRSAATLDYKSARSVGALRHLQTTGGSTRQAPPAALTLASLASLLAAAMVQRDACFSHRHALVLD